MRNVCVSTESRRRHDALPRPRIGLGVVTTILLVLALLKGCTFLTSSAATTPFLGTWYVAQGGSDRNDGMTADTPFATITQAARRARPGDVVSVAPGTYFGKVVTNSSGSDERPITFLSAEPFGARIEAPGEHSAWENRGEYLDIVGFDISGSDYVGILNYGSHVSVRGNRVHDLVTPSCNRPNGGGGIVHTNPDAHGNETLDNIVFNIVPPLQRGEMCPLLHGIYQANREGRIQNNIVYNVTHAGIHLWHGATAIVIANNLVWDTAVGILIGGQNVRKDDNVVTNNILLYNRIGIQEFGSNFGDDNVYIANLLHDNATDFDMRNGEPTDSIFDPAQMVDFRRDGTGDYRLLRSSPGVDGGTDLGAPTHDRDGVPRPQFEGFDIGPYELPDRET